jgi:hypothetical protein
MSLASTTGISTTRESTLATGTVWRALRDVSVPALAARGMKSITIAAGSVLHFI